MPKPTILTESDKSKVTKISSKSVVKPKLSKKSLFKFLLWLVLFTVVGFTSYTIARNKAMAANKPAEKALVALKDNKPVAVYELGTDEFKKFSTLVQVKAVVEQWSKIVNQTTEGKPELVSKKESTKDKKQLTTLLYKYQIKPGKSKINQKELFVAVVVQKVDKEYKLYTFNIDSQK